MISSSSPTDSSLRRNCRRFKDSWSCFISERRSIPDAILEEHILCVGKSAKIRVVSFIVDQRVLCDGSGFMVFALGTLLFLYMLWVEGACVLSSLSLYDQKVNRRN